ncbi:MAG: glycosidase [Syntrophomonadaceae bacterium]|nr:glycosidase [Syntrophomonadaceae bacterium]
MTHHNTESQFDEVIKQISPQLSQFSDFDLIIGIPFNNEKDTLALVLQSLDNVLQSWIGRRQLILCVGDSSAQETLDSIKKIDIKHPRISFLLPAEISGRGMSVRTIIEISERLEADLLLFSANMASEKGPGIDSAWLESLLTPIQGHYDLVLGSLRRHLGIDSIAHMMAAPFLEVFYGCRVGDPLGGIYAISHDFIEELAHEARFWGKSLQGYGIDFWLLTRALCWNKHICEVNMGGIVNPHSLHTRNRIFRDNACIIFESLRRDSAIWLQDRLVVKVADIIARSEINRPDFINYPIPELLQNFKELKKKYGSILKKCDYDNEIEKLDTIPINEFTISDQLWVSALFCFLLNYNFEAEEQKDNLLAALTALYNGRVASYALEMRAFSDSISFMNERERDAIMVGKMDSIRQQLTSRFWLIKPELTRQWLHKREQNKPPIIPLGYMEYVPGKPIVVPKKIVGKDHRIVNTDNIFRELRKRYENNFNKFISEGLELDSKAKPDQIIAAVEKYMDQLENTLDEVFPGDLHSEIGLKRFVNGLFEVYPRHCMFTVGEDLLREMLVRFPPVNIMIPLAYYKPADLIKNMDTRDAVTYANFVEGRGYSDQILFWLLDNLKPESLEWVEIKPLILKEELRPGILSQGRLSYLNRVTARITIKYLEDDRGGKYPKIRYFTSIVRRLAIAEHYSRLFNLNVLERKNIGLKLRSALLDLQKGDDFCAYTIFENYHHRRLVEKIRYLAQHLYEKGNKKMARTIELMADGYGLSQVLENETFLTCSAWSWASYSFKGGRKIPTPLTTSVENRWFNHDFLESLYEELGYDAEEIMEIVFRLIPAGKSKQNLLDTLLPARPKDVAVVVQETTNEPSKYLQRYQGNPILEPLEESEWESKYVLNPGALRIKDKVYLFYRAVGDDDISHIGLAITDGYKVLQRLPRPIFSPATSEENMGCEDPRLIIIEDRIFMLYTAYDGNIAQIAAASIGVDEFLKGKYEQWTREGLAFKNIWDKDAILFPEKINNRYVIYHRIEPSIWVTYMKEIKFPSKENHAIIIGPRPGRMWDSLKIGAGAQPLKTKYGWLLIYHGVDYNYVYRLGVILVALNNPEKVIYRSPNPVLEPEEEYEIGISGAWVPNVVFTCGAVPALEKDILEDDDEILVYYGAADTSIGMAKATLADLIPEAFRNFDH